VGRKRLDHIGAFLSDAVTIRHLPFDRFDDRIRTAWRKD
jgi:hypothetical protein